MNDRELLEYAAKACGIDGAYGVASDDYYYDGNVEGILTILPDGQSYVWNPLTNSGDALELAVKRGMEVNTDWAKLCVRVWDGIGEYYYEQLSTDSINCDIDPYAATRRAIVRAAAEIGRSMK
jgi:hypothetical protein